MVLLRLALGFAAASCISSPLVAGDEKDFYRAYYLEHEEKDLEAARKLYLEVAGDKSTDGELRKRAEAAAAALAEDLATSDFTRLVPRDAMFYAELSRPGEQLSLLLEQLGLLGRVEQGKGFGVSPLLVDGILGLRGAAIAVTSFDPERGPSGVVLLHPGDLDVVRGLIETALPAAGEAAEPIEGFATWSIEGEAYVTLTNRLLVASRDRDEIAGVIARMQKGAKAGDSLADNAALKSVLERGDGLLSFCVNAEPLLPMLQGMLAQQAANDPGAAMALAFLDVKSLRSVSGHVGIDEEGVNLELALELAEGHQNLAFNLLRMPQVEPDTLKQVPSGAAFFVALGLNPAGDVAPITKDAAGQPVVTFLDFGRELFGNIIDVTAYGVPPAAASKGQRGAPIPDVALLLGVNDVERSQALWNFVLGSGSGATGGAMAPKSEEIAGRDATRYTIAGVPVYVARNARGLVISPSRAAVERALQTKGEGSILDDKVFAADVRNVQNGHTIVAMANPGRCVALAGAMGEHDERMQMAAELLKDTVVTFGLEHTDTRLALKARVSNIPDVSALVAERMHAGRRRGQVAAAGKFPVASVASVPAGASRDTLRASFDRLASEGQHAQALAVGRDLLDVAFKDAFYLNDMAWALSTKKPYEGHYVDLALAMAERANEITSYKNWFFVDTLALVMFQKGEVKEAVKLSRQAVELAGNDPRSSEAKAALKRYEAALEPAVTTAAAGGG